MKKIYHILLWAGILLLPCCSIYQKYESGATVPDQVMGDIVDPQDTVSVGSLDWHALFQDPLLQQLIEKALANKDSQIDTLYFLSLYDEEAGDNEAALKKLEKAVVGRFSPLNYCSKETVEKEILRLKGVN